MSTNAVCVRTVHELSRTLCDDTTNQYHPAVSVLSVFVYPDGSNRAP